MGRLLRKIGWLAIALAPYGCGSKSAPPPPAAPAPALGAQFYRWPSFPVALSAESGLLDGAARNEDLLAAISFWEEHAGRRLFRLEAPWAGPGLPFTGSPSQPDSILANSMLFEGPWSFEPNVAGTTVLRFEGAVIKGAVVLLDPATTLCTGLCEGNDTATSLRRLIAHELGHFLGLGHDGDRANIMYPAILPGGSLDDRGVNEEELRRRTE